MAVSGRRGIPVLLAALITLVCSACGTGVALKDQNDSTPTGGVIKVGAPYPLTGAWAENGRNALRGMEVAVKEINASGGIKALGGARLKIVSADTGSTDPSQARTATTKLIDTDHVSAVVGSFLSSMSLTVSTVAEQSRVPFVTQSLIDQLVTRGYKYTFKVPANTSATGPAALRAYLDIAASHGPAPTKVAVFTSNDAASKAQSDALRAEAEKRGLSVVAYKAYSPGLTDASAIVTPLAAAEPEVVFGAGSVSDLTMIVKNLRDRGIRTPIVGSGGTGFLGKGLKEGLGDETNGLLAISGWSDDLKLPGVGQARARYRSQYHEPFMPNEAGESWVAMHLVAEAMENAHSSAPAAVAKALRATPATSGPASSMPPGRVGFDASGFNSGVVPIMIQWQNGRPRTVWPASVATVTPTG
ncbi:ABC transporter substrate-binding protein [Streptomyces rugosispiralis]|uniref:ABC transporter substrate-binding protein n=1 Tax=Streptomyces rugosispiralis TaxID=2967341 RepID=A0ABT1V5R4_9ACTN|nr:ABC transporter substrate-binding protein [Streptomyces rugosispiralis]MCQ8192636.1 ABC transporter substrate-binding protein [Streptomyces rugosispiralis]